MIDSIFKLYPQVVRTVGDDAFDADGNLVEIDLAVIEAYEKANEYKKKRQAAYPPMQDYIDGLVKGDQAQMQSYIDKCLAVKAQFPKEQM